MSLNERQNALDQASYRAPGMNAMLMTGRDQKLFTQPWPT
jgi:hypothetical protein